MPSTNNAFTEFEHQGWQSVADKYDSTWSSSTRQFIPPLLDTAGVRAQMSILDVGCGPGYVSAAVAQRDAVPIGLDFSTEMLAIAGQMFSSIEFQEGDAQNLSFSDSSFDRVLANFALLHVADPHRACAEACRVLKPGGKFAFTVWAPARQTPEALRAIQSAIENVVKRYPEGDGFAVPKTAHLVAITKKN